MNTVAEFQARRRKVLRTAGPWILIGLVGALLAIFFGEDASAPLSQRAPVLIAAAGFCACILVGARIVHRHYRCPACGRVPGARYGILLGLSKCPSCGARLK
jgi:peptidoglycan/LPS O-acetylase OafA/YrhL